MRTFKHFPKSSICRICGTNKDKETTLIPIDGTEEGNNIQAEPVHLECLANPSYTYYPHDNILVAFIRCK